MNPSHPADPALPEPFPAAAPIADGSSSPGASGAEHVKPAVPTSRGKDFLRAVGMLPVLILLCIGFAVSSETFASWQNFSIITQQASINIVLAAGMTFVILTGGIDLAVGSILAASAVVAMLMSNVPGLGMLGVPVGLACGLLFGLINGVLVAFV